MKARGVKIEHIEPNSPAEKGGLKKGDIIISINKHRIKDTLDLIFYSGDEILRIDVLRDGEIINLIVEKAYKPFGVEVEPFRVKKCRNKCLFCFVEQLPKGLRKSLYIKDEDYRASFLYGNYITLTNLTKDDYARIKKLNLNPLYVSVHATDPDIRNKLLGNYDAPPILSELKKLKKNKIKVHTQIVLCPGINDGEVLEKTITDLYKLYPYVSSIAIVPVGLTKYHKNNLQPVTKQKAEEIIALVESYQKRFFKKHGITIVYLADEFYIKAEKDFPKINFYDDLPQLENGVGMVPLFLHKVKKLSIPTINLNKRVVTFTGISFYPFLLEFVEKLKKNNIIIDLIPIKNNLFGGSVTVTGLLSGEDIIKGLAPYVEKNNIVLVPETTMNDVDNKFLDDLTLNDIERILEVKTLKVGTDPSDLISVLKTLN